MIMKKFVALFALLFAATAGQAANLYILYDDTCMDRLEYAYLNHEDEPPYIVYQVESTPGEKTILEVGPESQIPQDFMPSQFIRCSNAVFDEQLVNAINSNIDRVHMVVQKGNRYFVSPIIFASRFMRSDNFIVYDSPKYRFQFDLDRGTIGENIALQNPKAKVYFEGRLDNECSGAYLFHQYAEFDGSPHTDLVLIPEVGIVEKRNGINVDDALNNTLRLQRVNGRKLDRHLKRICQGVTDDTPPTPAEQDFVAKTAQPEFYTVGQQPESYSNEAYTAPEDPLAQVARSPLPAAPQDKAQTHTVKKGETLYRIAKNYGVTVAQIREWNQKGSSNTIYPGEALQVSATPKPSAEPVLMAKGGAEPMMAASNPPRYESRPTQMTEGGEHQKYHLVKPGETIASIALKYGYTEPRFREMNGLSENTFARVGQQLRITDCPCDCDEQAPANSPAPQSYGQTATARIPSATSATSGLQAKGATQEEQEAFSGSAIDFDAPAASQQVDGNYNTPYFLDRAATPQPAPQSYYAPSAAASSPAQYNAVPAQPTRTVYIVKEGDSLYSIARNYGTTVEQLRAINNLERNEVLVPYQRIYLN